MNKTESNRTYDLEERTYEFAKDVRSFLKRIHNSPANAEDGKQLIRSSGSVGANYIEANEAISKKDFILRIKICRKEAKESKFWLKLIDTRSNPVQEQTRDSLMKEADELTNIFGAILRNSKKGKKPE